VFSLLGLGLGFFVPGSGLGLELPDLGLVLEVLILFMSLLTLHWHNGIQAVKTVEHVV